MDCEYRITDGHRCALSWNHEGEHVLWDPDLAVEAESELLAAVEQALEAFAQPEYEDQINRAFRRLYTARDRYRSAKGLA